VTDGDGDEDDDDDGGETWWCMNEPLGCKWLPTPFYHLFNLHLSRAVKSDSSATECVGSCACFHFILCCQFP
jgi:hypothetical protein